MELLPPEPDQKAIRIHARMLANRLPSNLDGSCELEEAIAIISQAIRDGIACEGLRCSRAAQQVQQKYLAASKAVDWQHAAKIEALAKMFAAAEVSSSIGEPDPRYES